MGQRSGAGFQRRFLFEDVGATRQTRSEPSMPALGLIGA